MYHAFVSGVSCTVGIVLLCYANNYIAGAYAIAFGILLIRLEQLERQVQKLQPKLRAD